MKQKEVPEFTEQELTQLTDQQLLQEAKKMKSTNLTNAFFIGFLIAIVLYSVVKNTYGLVTVIPLYFAYKIIKNSKNNKANKILQTLLEKRNLKK